MNGMLHVINNEETADASAWVHFCAGKQVTQQAETLANKIGNAASRTRNGKPEMYSTKIITSLTLAASLAAGMALATGPQSAFAKTVCVTDHRGPGPARTVCNNEVPDWKGNYAPGTGPRPTNVDPKRPNEVIVSSDKHTVEGVRNDGTVVRTQVETNRIVNRYNKDGSVDRVQELRQADGSWKDQGVISHRPPKHVDLGSCPFWGC